MRETYKLFSCPPETIFIPTIECDRETTQVNKHNLIKRRLTLYQLGPIHIMTLVCLQSCATYLNRHILTSTNHSPIWHWRSTYHLCTIGTHTAMDRVRTSAPPLISFYDHYSYWTADLSWQSLFQTWLLFGNSAKNSINISTWGMIGGLKLPSINPHVWHLLFCFFQPQTSPLFSTI